GLSSSWRSTKGGLAAAAVDAAWGGARRAGDKPAARTLSGTGNKKPRNSGAWGRLLYQAFT
ncbi:MAG: hypothetical protein ACO38B_07570, partial [Burkholderiaceae bacterium]